MCDIRTLEDEMCTLCPPPPPMRVFIGLGGEGDLWTGYRRSFSIFIISARDLDVLNFSNGGGVAKWTKIHALAIKALQGRRVPI